MANWYGKARSNRFAVKDRDAFLAGAKTRKVEVIEGAREDSKGRFALFSTAESGGWQTHSEAQDGHVSPVNIFQEAAEHLPVGEVAVFVEAGYESSRYVTGNSVAITNSGDAVTLDLNEIYAKAAKKFRVDIRSIARAMY